MTDMAYKEDEDRHAWLKFWEGNKTLKTSMEINSTRALD